MKNKSKSAKKGGWTLVELCIALIALSILVGIAIQSIKPKKFMVGPFAYAGIQNLHQANNYIKAQCKSNSGTTVYGCENNGTSLPDTDVALPEMVNYYNGVTDPEEKNKLGGLPTINNVDEVWCYHVASLFTLIDEKINCKYDNTSTTFTLTDANKNFQASNMVSYYFLNRKWEEITKASPTGDATPEALNAVSASPTKFKTVFIDTDGAKGRNKLGEDQFPVRVYITGEIIPGTCKTYPKEKDSPTTYCTPASHYSGDEAIYGPWISSSYPFAYNLVRAYKANPDDENMTTERLLSSVSYKEAACRSGRNIMIPREDLCNDTGADVSTSLTDGTFKVYEKCKSDYTPEGGTPQNAFCIVLLSRPSNPGLFKLPLL